MKDNLYNVNSLSTEDLVEEATPSDTDTDTDTGTDVNMPDSECHSDEPDETPNQTETHENKGKPTTAQVLPICQQYSTTSIHIIT